MECSDVRFTRHAFERLFARAISPDLVIRIIREGEAIASYPDDLPFPSVLLLGFEREEPIHVVVAKDAKAGTCFVVTVYRPAPEMWTHDFKTPRKL